MISRLLITGAAGRLGGHLRSSLRPYAQTLRLSDIAAMPPAVPSDGMSSAASIAANSGSGGAGRSP